MEWKLFGTVFASQLVAELGDETQLAIMLYAADSAQLSPRSDPLVAGSTMRKTSPRWKSST